MSKPKKEVSTAKNADLELKIEFLKAILDSIPDPIFIKDRKHRWIEFNEAFCQLVGQNREALMLKTDHDFFPKEQADFFHAKDEEVFKNRVENISEEELTDQEGVIHTLSTKKTVKDIPNFGPALIGTIRDITSYKDSEKQIAEERARAFSDSKIASLGEMAGGMGHEINNPLAVVIGNTSLLRKEVEKNTLTNDKLLNSLTKIEKASERIAKIVQSLRNFSRSAKQDPFQLISVFSIVMGTLEFCKSRFRNASIDLTISVDPFLSISCHPSEISHVLLNLMNNAFDAVSNSEERWVRISALKEDQKVLIIVTDSGSGISDLVAKKIMQPFFTTKEVGKGTGLGLSISHQIIEHHKGVLRLNRDSKNTEFVIELPIVEN